VPVVVEQAVQRRPAVKLGLVPSGGVGGVRADQIVKPVPTRGGLLQEVGVEELLEQPARAERGGVE
jgi:hypothetical protein